MRNEMKMFNSLLKSFLIFFSLIFLLINKTNAQSVDELLRQGVKYYQEQNYESSSAAFEKILSQGFESPALYYNLGNAYFKSGKLGYAILNYERGLKLAPSDEDLDYNLRIANARTVDKIEEVPKLFLVKWWESIVASFSVSGWSVIVIIIFLIFLTSIGLYMLAKNFQIQKISFVLGSASLSILIFAAIILFSRINHDAASNYGVMLEQVYNVKVTPDSKSSDAFVIHEGTKFLVEDVVNDWHKIRLIDGKVGWVQIESFGKI